MTDSESSNNVFEGPEKLLEIWFPDSIDLFKIPLQEISNLLKQINCSILSYKKSNTLHAYLLSESSLFVYENKLILKTCGQTITLFCLNYLFNLIKVFCNSDFSTNQITKIFYSRKSFMFPQHQHKIHQNWNSEIDYLNNFVNNDNSNSIDYILGDLNSNFDKWYVYIYSNNNSTTNNHPDFNMEILMTNLNPTKCNSFKLNKSQLLDADNNSNRNNLIDYCCKQGNDMMKNSKLDEILPFNDLDLLHDTYSFIPCGYSSNTLINNDYYYTFHITPELDYSYASFETNFIDFSTDKSENGNKDKILKTVNSVIDKFHPNEFQLIIFNNYSILNMDLNYTLIPNYKCIVQSTKNIDDYVLYHCLFRKS